MKKILVLAFLAAAAAVVAVTSTAASGAGTTLDLRGVVTGFHVALDTKPTGQSAGDIGYETGNLSAHGKRIGRFQGVCTQLPHGSSQCSFTLGLPNGQILIEAAYAPASTLAASPGKPSSAAQESTPAPAAKASTANSAIRSSRSTLTSRANQRRAREGPRASAGSSLAIDPQ